jgi:multiple sugar transport system substrate-binding protein/putative aldouronate transport system substrate-binding protein
VAPGSGYNAPADDSEIQTLRNQIKAVIVNESWKAAMATSQSDFDSIIKSMQDTVKGLGYAKVLKIDMEHAKAQNAARLAVAKKFG